jgi:predicted metalloendopeptidase
MAKVIISLTEEKKFIKFVNFFFGEDWTNAMIRDEGYSLVSYRSPEFASELESQNFESFGKEFNNKKQCKELEKKVKNSKK